MDTANFIREALSRPPVVIAYSVSQDLAASFPDKALIASTMRWLATQQPGTMDEVQLTQVRVLREQMASIPLPGDDVPPPDTPMLPMPGQFAHGRLLGRQVHYRPGM